MQPSTAMAMPVTFSPRRDERADDIRGLRAAERLERTAMGHLFRTTRWERAGYKQIEVSFTARDRSDVARRG
jgi:hypothetical protein